MVAETSLSDDEQMTLKKTGVPPAVFDRGNEYTRESMGFKQYCRLQIPYSMALTGEIIATLAELGEGIAKLRKESLTSEWRYALRLQVLIDAANARLRHQSKQSRS